MCYKNHLSGIGGWGREEVEAATLKMRGEEQKQKQEEEGVGGGGRREE